MGISSTILHPPNARPAAADEVVVVAVAVKADAKEIPSAALIWALTHVVHPGDCLTLLVVVPARKLWGFPLFARDCATGPIAGTILEKKAEIMSLCSKMMSQQLHNVYDPKTVHVKIKIVPGSPCGSVAAESKRAHASWVILDKQLKSEEKQCLDELQCNIVAMKRSQLKVLRLNLVGTPDPEPLSGSILSSELEKLPGEITEDAQDSRIRAPFVTPVSSPEIDVPFSATEAGTSSVSTSSDSGTSPNFERNGGYKKDGRIDTIQEGNLHVTSSDSDTESLTHSASLKFEPWMAGINLGGHRSSKQDVDLSQRVKDNTYISNVLGEKFPNQGGGAGILNYRSDQEFCGSFREGGINALNNRLDPYSSRKDNGAKTSSRDYISELDFEGSVREAISRYRNSPPGPPPLCSICQHKAPLFGKPPRWFSYAELELATGGFSQANYLAEGGYGSVHRGVLPDGQAVAVKQHKLASSQGDHEFCSEVEVLSCAQHCNVVMLIGYCTENNRRLLVYEYICNGSLHSHLYGRNKQPLEWSARQKIAVGAARGLRYLHEDCRVGCIVHRDMRPHNILLTHDFKPLVGDFGLARCQPDGDLGEETRVIGTIGYMAPEYSQTGQITEKADVYSFGVVLVELITGRKAMDINRPKGQQLLVEWARPLLEEYAIGELMDPRLANCYTRHEVLCMMRAASLCIRRDPHDRPRMSQVLRILEGNMGMEPSYFSTPGGDPASRSGRLRPEPQQRQQDNPNVGQKQSYGISSSAWGRDRVRQFTCLD